MATFLFTWNPKKFHWDESENIENIVKHHPVSYNWSCRSHKPKIGDDFFLMRVGCGGFNAIVASGKITSEPYEDRSFLSTERTNLIWYVDIKIEHMDLSGVSQAYLKFMYPAQCWSPQSSGILVDEYIAEKVKKNIYTPAKNY